MLFALKVALASVYGMSVSKRKTLYGGNEGERVSAISFSGVYLILTVLFSKYKGAGAHV